jgi:NitT/TauT family transport system permease protein
MKKDKILNLLLPLLTVGCILIIWSVFARVIDNQFLLPNLKLTFTSLITLFGSGEFYLAFVYTFLRSLVAFIVSFILATTLALIGNANQTIKRVIKILISICRALPTIAVVLLLLFWTNSQVAPVIVTMLVVLPTIYTNVDNSLNEIDKDQLEMCKLFNVHKKVVLTKVKIPQIAPSMVNTIGSGLSLNLKLMVAAEVLSQTANSLGYMLNTSKVYFEIAMMIAIVLVTVILGIVIESAFSKLSERLGKWK